MIYLEERTGLSNTSTVAVSPRAVRHQVVIKSATGGDFVISYTPAESSINNVQVQGNTLAVAAGTSAGLILEANASEITITPPDGQPFDLHLSAS